MKGLRIFNRLTGLCAVVLMLHGCAAATVIRKQPDFDDENQRRLLQTFQPGAVA
ncbi:MAG: hypothetical protein WBO34_11285 [Gammaproteobacteria bacterium]